MINRSEKKEIYCVISLAGDFPVFRMMTSVQWKKLALIESALFFVFTGHVSLA
jgi:hypothetical protein